MRIVITADPYLPVPPKLYGGIERVIDFLVRGLVRRGHGVTLVAHPDSDVPAALAPYGAPPHFRSDRRLVELWQVGSRLWSMRREVDVIHSFGRLAALLPVLPFRSPAKIQSYQRDLLPESGIRRAIRLSRGSLSFTACATHMYAGKGIRGSWTTVFNGVDFEKYTPVERLSTDAPLAFLGRLERMKGAHHAIQIARAAGRRLELAGNVVRSGPDAGYFESEIAPHVDGEEIRYLGPVDDDQKNALLGRASALLMPIEWDEPFGIVMVEAMACGTPVVAFDRGSVREVVREGVNGFIVSDRESAVEALTRIPSLDRSTVRRDAEDRFGAETIVSDYERLYQSVLSS
jgi:glycosyltransferase involved in cell wall biosynthesis